MAAMILGNVSAAHLDHERDKVKTAVVNIPSLADHVSTQEEKNPVRHGDEKCFI